MFSRATVAVARTSVAGARSMSFARVISVKVNSVDQGKALDKVIADHVLPQLSKVDGYAGSERLLCGGKLDYKLITKYSTLDALKASGEKSADHVKTAAEKSNIPVQWFDSQNFMHTPL